MLRDGWPALANAIRECQVVSANAGVLRLDAPAPRAKLLAEAAAARALASAVAIVMDAPWQIELVVTGAVAAPAKKPGWNVAQEHPVVQDLVRRFEADVISRARLDREAWLERLKEERR